MTHEGVSYMAWRSGSTNWYFEYQTGIEKWGRWSGRHHQVVTSVDKSDADLILAGIHHRFINPDDIIIIIIGA